METVIHNEWGIGTVVKREARVKGQYVADEHGNYLTVRFDNGKEMICSIPKSFENGVLKASGALLEEVEAAAAELERKRTGGIIDGISDGIKPLEEVDTRVVKKPAKILLTGDTRKDYEAFLRASGYRENVVYQYPRSVDIVCNNEGIDYDGLRAVIATVVKLYDKGGAKEKEGNYQHRTTINALKRFREFTVTNY